MGAHSAPDGVEQGDSYQHANGMREVVYAVESGTVLTLREYPTATDFKEEVDGAEYTGVNLGVASLSDPAQGTDLDP